jgi:hypothetical protein
MTTLFDILKNAYLELGQLENHLATGGGVNTMIDTKMADKYGDNDLVDGTLFVIRDGGGSNAAPEGEAQSIISNDEASSTVTVGANFTAAIAAGDTIGIAKNVYPLYTLIDLTNRALASLGTIQLTDTSLTTITDHTEYALPVALKYKQPVRVQIQTETDDADDNKYVDVNNWYVVPSAAGSTGLLIFNGEYTSGYKIKLWYETEHPRLSLMTDKLSETIHSEYATMLVAVKALQWQNDRQSGQDAYMLQRLNKAAADLEDARRRFSPQKERKAKYLVPGLGKIRHQDVSKAEL